MQKHHDTIQEKNGDVITSATVTIYDANTGTPSSIFEDDETTPLSNPFTVSDDNYDDKGNIFFKAANGDYDIKIVNGASTSWKYDVKLFDSDDAGILLNNITATVPPTVNDDSDDGYSEGSYWIDVTGDQAYRCVDDTVGAAVWIKTTLQTTDLGALALLNTAPIANGGTGQITAQAAIDALSQVSGATNEYVLTKDTATGNVIFKESAAGLLPNGYINGLILSNDTDTDHDINITVGIAADSAGSYTLTLTSETTKQIDAAWAAGDDVGGLFSGSVAVDTWYHVFLIRKDSDGSIDAGFDTSITAANTPAGYTAYRRIGSVLTDGSANILGFTQDGDLFTLDTLILDLSGTQGATATTRTVSAPLGIKTEFWGRFYVQDNISNLRFVANSLDQDDAVTSTSYSIGAQIGGASAYNTSQELRVMTNTSSQIRTRASVAIDVLNIQAVGWTDTRGKD